jgi:ABC-type dipeptide/oligopeptide/nickel transport system ATPase component
MTDYQPIPSTKVIGIVGRAGHGKDEAAGAICRVIPDARRYTFSDAIAIYARIQCGMKKRDPKLLQEIGTGNRDANPDIWASMIYWQIHDHKPPLAVITGVRFREEARIIRRIGGTLLRVSRFNPDGTLFVLGDRDETHAAESEVDTIYCDDTICNFELPDFLGAVTKYATRLR